MPVGDRVHSLTPRKEMCEGARKLRDAYDSVPGSPLYQTEFGGGYFFTRDRWRDEGMPPDADLAELFRYDPPGEHVIPAALGDNILFPHFRECVLEERGEHEVVGDKLGRKLLCFKGRREGFMPKYIGHQVKDRTTWEENVKWRLDPGSAGRAEGLDLHMDEARKAAACGMIVTESFDGAFMFLRGLFGSVELLYAFYDMPDVIEDCMAAWFAVIDATIGRHQRHVTIDQIQISEDICYKTGPLIAPKMIRQFLMPCYQQLVANVRRRQPDPGRKLYLHVDTDGRCAPVIPLYREIGMTLMSPFEVAAGCNVVEMGKEFPWLAMSGGIDKRVLATTPDQIDRHLEAILPAMRKRGGYIPTCDHGVPAEVSYSNYQHYRRRSHEMGE
ncbi:MAG: uroporphyrinogen decarboxylase family protein [bacterium]|nr:hypothetical protein [Candidatus Sumerlaeota bacterium]